MKTRIWLIAVTMLIAAVAYGSNVKDKMTFEAPVTFKGAVTNSAAQTLQGANPLVFEGATTNAYQTTISVTDPTADRTVTVPNATGTMGLDCVASHDFGSVAGSWSMTAAEAACSFITFTNLSSTAASITKPASTAGKFHTVYNNGGKTITFKVTGQTGATIATGKYGIYADNGTDVVEIYEIP